MRYILPFLLLLLSMNAKAQDYLPVLTEGKVWNCLYKDLSLSGNDPIKFQISVAGNAVVEKKTARNCSSIILAVNVKTIPSMPMRKARSSMPTIMTVARLRPC